MGNKTYKKVVFFLVLFVLCMFSSHTIGKSFSVQGTPSSIVRLKISNKTIKGVKNNSITDANQHQKGYLNLVVTERRQTLGGGAQDNDSFFEQDKINKFEHNLALCHKVKTTSKPISFSATIKVLRI